MNATTRQQLDAFATAAEYLREIVPELAPVPQVAGLDTWEAIDAARGWFDAGPVAAGRDCPGHDAPAAYAHHHRAAWLAVLVAAGAACGAPVDDEAAGWLDSLTTAELAAELDHLAECHA